MAALALFSHAFERAARFLNINKSARSGVSLHETVGDGVIDLRSVLYRPNPSAIFPYLRHSARYLHGKYRGDGRACDLPIATELRSAPHLRLPCAVQGR